MLRRLFSFHKPAPETSVLPPDVAAAIEAAHLLMRTGVDDNGDPRVLVTVPGRRFFGDAESVAAAVSAKWPDLNPSQHRRACEWLRSLVAARLRAEVHTVGDFPTRWADWKPHDEMEIDYR